MSAEVDEQEADEIPDDPPGGEDSSTPSDRDDRDDEKPALDSDEVADVDLDLDGLTEQVQEATGDAQDDEPDAEGQESEADDDASEALGTSFGEMYVDTLAVVLWAIVEETGDGEPDLDAEGIAEMATSAPMHLDQHVDAVAAEYAGGGDLPPGKAAVTMTALLAGIVLVQETDLAGDLVGRAGDALEEARD